MGSFDGAETCELAGSYLLSKLSPLLGNAVGLYRDDGLAALNKTPREIENIKKQICTTLNDHNLRLTIEANKKRVDYLDITLDLITASYKPFNKPGNEIQYVNHRSNHPPAIFRIKPDAIKKRLFKISSGEQAFNSAAPPYQKALKDSGHDHELAYNPQPRKSNRQRIRNAIWFNPPFNANVSINIGRRFLAIIDECFPQNHPLRKICNRNTLKLSYSCMPNIASIISSHNKTILTKHTNAEPTVCDTCKCRQKMSCPLDGKCLAEGVVYQATVKREDTGDVQT